MAINFRHVYYGDFRSNSLSVSFSYYSGISEESQATYGGEFLFIHSVRVQSTMLVGF